MLQRRSGTPEGLQTSHRSEGLVPSIEQRLRGARPVPLPSLISPALHLEQRQCRLLGPALFEQGCSSPHPRDARLRGCQRIFTQCVYYYWPCPAHHQPFPGWGSISTSRVWHPAKKEGHMAGSFFALQVAVKYCPKLVQNCLDHFHQRIHFSLAWW